MNLLATPARRRFLFAALYMSEGAPIGFLWWALPTLLRSHQVPIEQITALTSVLVFPWAFKFLWAPLVDILQSRLSLKTWILTTQGVMGLFLLPLFFLDFQRDALVLGIFLILHSLAAATQDVSIDALCIRVTHPSERGTLNGWMQAGMLTGRSLLGGGALVVADSLGLKVVLVLLLVVVWFSSLLLIFSRIPILLHQQRIASARAAFMQTLRTTFSSRTTWYALAFAGIAGAGYEAAGAVAGPFLLDRGFSSSDVGWFFLIPAVLLTITGSLAGGRLADVFPRQSAVRLFLLLMAGSVVLLGVLDLQEDLPGWWFLGGMSLLYLCIGFFVSSTYALFMDLTHPDLGATQFSTFMSATNLCESWSSFAIGRMVGGWGYSPAFIIMAIVSILTAPLVRVLKPPASDSL